MLRVRILAPTWVDGVLLATGEDITLDESVVAKLYRKGDAEIVPTPGMELWRFRRNMGFAMKRRQQGQLIELPKGDGAKYDFLEPVAEKITKQLTAKGKLPQKKIKTQDEKARLLPIARKGFGRSGFVLSVYCDRWSPNMEPWAWELLTGVEDVGARIVRNKCTEDCDGILAFGRFVIEEATAAAAKYEIPLWVLNLDVPHGHVKGMEKKQPSGPIITGYRRADRICAISSHAAKETGKFAGLPHVDTVYLGRPTESMVSKRQVISIGRLVPNKRHDVVIRALGMLDDPPGLRIVAWGKSPGAKLKMQKHVDLGIQHGVKVSFGIDLTEEEKLREIDASIAMVYASDFDGWGIPPLEGILRGKPVVCSRIPVLDEFYGRYAIMFKPNDVADCAKKLKKAIADNGKPIYKSEVVQSLARQYGMKSGKRRLADWIWGCRVKSKVHPRPLVSVGMIVLNGGKWIEESLRSVYDWPHCHEIVIVEGAIRAFADKADGGRSTDDTYEKIMAFPDPEGKIRVIRSCDEKADGLWIDKREQRNRLGVFLAYFYQSVKVLPSIELVGIQNQKPIPVHFLNIAVALFAFVYP